MFMLNNLCNLKPEAMELVHASPPQAPGGKLVNKIQLPMENWSNRFSLHQSSDYLCHVTCSTFCNLRWWSWFVGRWIVGLHNPRDSLLCHTPALTTFFWLLFFENVDLSVFHFMLTGTVSILTCGQRKSIPMSPVAMVHSNIISIHTIYKYGLNFHFQAYILTFYIN